MATFLFALALIFVVGWAASALRVRRLRAYWQWWDREGSALPEEERKAFQVDWVRRQWRILLAEKLLQGFLVTLDAPSYWAIAVLSAYHLSGQNALQLAVFGNVRDFTPEQLRRLGWVEPACVAGFLLLWRLVAPLQGLALWGTLGLAMAATYVLWGKLFGVFAGIRKQEPGELEKQVSEVFARAGLPGVECYRVGDHTVMGKNIFVRGGPLGLMRPRVYIADSVTQLLTPEELESTLLHEASHVLLGHVNVRLFLHLSSYLVFFFLFMLSVFTAWLWIEARIPDADPLWFVLVPAGGTLALMTFLGLNHWVYRQQEFEADGFAIKELGASGSAMESALRKLSLANGHSSSPAGSAGAHALRNWLSTHPRLEERYLRMSSPSQLEWEGRHAAYQALGVVTAVGLLCVGWLGLCLKEYQVGVAARLGETDWVAQALDEGREVDSPLVFAQGLTPLAYASLHGRPGTVKYLLEQGADPNVAVEWGNKTAAGVLGRVRPLHLAVVSGNAEVVKLLVRAHADGSPAGTDGRTADQIATLLGDTRVMAEMSAASRLEGRLPAAVSAPAAKKE